jgi:O-acetyl-ADP-ribose deacetylase (regulator of RNase III)
MRVAMIRFVTGDILTSDVEALVNTVNCVGVMGRGVALQFKNAFPNNYKAYVAACAKQEVQPGKMFVYQTHSFNNPKYIINFPTKRHWKGKSRLEDIESGLVDLVEVIKHREIKSIALPPLGSGLGGLDWSVVRRMIEIALGKLEDIDVLVFEPSSEVDTRVNPSRDVPKMTPGRAALVALVSQYLSALMDPFITLLEIQKLMYFLQESGQDLRLRFNKATYGPYADNLRHVLLAIEGHLLVGYGRGGDNPDKQVELIPGALVDSESYLASDSQTHGRLDRVSDLVDGFETPSSLELLATVHWVVTRERVSDLDGVVEKTYEWGSRKKRFSKDQIEIAFDTLKSKGWLST